MTVTWSEDLKVGIAVLDEQHEEFFELVNMLEKNKASDVCFCDLLGQVHRYIDVHFQTEEEYMRLTSYDKYQKHKEHHDKFSKEFSDLIKKHYENKGIIEARVEIINFIEAWVELHYNNDDIEMAKYLITKVG